MTTSADELVRLLATAQEGVVSTRQARLLGMSDDQVRHRLRSGRWERGGPGVIVFPGHQRRWQTDLMSLWLVAGPDAVVSHRWAARLLGLDGPDPTGIPDITVLRGHKDRVGQVRLHTTRTLDSVDIVSVRRDVSPKVRRDPRLRRARPVTVWRCTTASRTIVDLAGAVDDRALDALIDSACRSGHSSPAYLATRLASLRRPGRRGTASVAAALGDAGGHSFLERRFLALVREHGLP